MQLVRNSTYRRFWFQLTTPIYSVWFIEIRNVNGLLARIVSQGLIGGLLFDWR